MLIRLKKVDYQAKCAYSPPTKEVICESRLIIGVEPIDTRVIDKCVQITFVDGVKWVCVGTVEEIMEKLK